MQLQRLLQDIEDLRQLLLKLPDPAAGSAGFRNFDYGLGFRVSVHEFAG